MAENPTQTLEEGTPVVENEESLSLRDIGKALADNLTRDEGIVVDTTKDVTEAFNQRVREAVEESDAPPIESAGKEAEPTSEEVAPAPAENAEMRQVMERLAALETENRSLREAAQKPQEPTVPAKDYSDLDTFGAEMFGGKDTWDKIKEDDLLQLVTKAMQNQSALTARSFYAHYEKQNEVLQRLQEQHTLTNLGIDEDALVQKHSWLSSIAGDARVAAMKDLLEREGKPGPTTPQPNVERPVPTLNAQHVVEEHQASTPRVDPQAAMEAEFDKLSDKDAFAVLGRMFEEGRILERSDARPVGPNVNIR